MLHLSSAAVTLTCYPVVDQQVCCMVWREPGLKVDVTMCFWRGNYQRHEEDFIVEHISAALKQALTSDRLFLNGSATCGGLHCLIIQQAVGEKCPKDSLLTCVQTEILKYSNTQGYGFFFIIPLLPNNLPPLNFPPHSPLPRHPHLSPPLIKYSESLALGQMPPPSLPGRQPADRARGSLWGTKGGGTKSGLGFKMQSREVFRMFPCLWWTQLFCSYSQA